MESLVVKNAYENNLKHIDVDIPLNAFTCVTGCSGCGKSSLVFDTIYAESQRGFLEGMSGNIYGQKLMNKPKVSSVENLRPALNISQNYYNVNPRSTIGTVTEISYYLRSLFSIINSDSKNTISENVFSANNPNSCCTNCYGLGIETVVSESLLIPDKEKTLLEGGILYYKGTSEGKEQAVLKALCEYYNIDVNKRISELTKKELSLLLYSNDKIQQRISYKEGKRRKQHYVTLQGAITDIQEKITLTNNTTSSSMYQKYMEEIPCHVCNGTRLKNEVLNYKVNGYNYYEIENMEFSRLYKWLKNFSYNDILESKKDLVSQLIDSMKIRTDALIRLNVGYLCLNRSIPSLSGGERQRIRVAAQLTCSLKGLIYILDEPCKGLHYRDIDYIIQATKDLISKGNTVVAIEHNKKYIASADNVIELGPVGGPDGGYVIDVSECPKSWTYSLNYKKEQKWDHYFKLEGIAFRNIKAENVIFPEGGITCITGVSGSGKSSLASVIQDCFERKRNINCEFFSGVGGIKRVVQVNQAPIGKTPRSTIVSYLDIYDEIRNLFSKTATAKKLKLSSSHFSMNVKGGRCECCQGTGLQKIELHYLPSSYITCPECEGKRFSSKVLSCEYKGKSILDVLDTPIENIIDCFSDSKKIYATLSCMINLGLGYLSLGQMSMNLSGGEAQRIKLARALSVTSGGKTLYILDEPTSGLNDVDIKRFEKTLLSLQELNETIMIIEHNIEFISRISDYIIDFGMNGGEKGGKIMANDFPKKVFQNKKSSLNIFMGNKE